MARVQPLPPRVTHAETRSTARSLPTTPPHATAAADVAARYGVTSERGLTPEQAAERLAREGPNELSPVERPSLPAMLWRTITEPFIVLLVGAGGLAVLLGETRDGLLILAGVVPIVAADVITGYRAERALDALRAASAPTALLRRGGVPVMRPAREVVTGDILLLTAGDVVAADARVLGSQSGLVDRSILTGESLPEEVGTSADLVAARLTERHSMVYAGTSVVGGSVEAVVVATGTDTEVGRISGSLGGRGQRRSPVQAELDRLVRIMLVAAVVLIVVTAGLGFVRGDPLGVNLLAAVSATIAAIPEEPPVLLAVILGLGAYRLLRRDVLVRRLNAQETLGAVDLILTDKTGTLTQNRLAVSAVVTPDGDLPPGADRQRVLADALRAEADAWQAARLGVAGSFTTAIRNAAQSEGVLPDLDPDLIESCEPAADGHPYSLVSFIDAGTSRWLAIGAPETVLRMGGQESAASLDGWRVLVADRATQGSRLLLLATRRDAEPWAPVALIAFRDPLRPEVGDAMAAATGAGIQTIMVTGDHPSTAAAISRDAAMTSGRVVTGDELGAWSEQRLAAELAGLHVVARASPTDKLRLVEAARLADRTVAVTGDGVNDAPALNRADVAVAMGSGTAVAREAADLVLGDDSFATLMDGLREGRRIIANVQKGLTFILSTHVALLGFIFIATVVGFSQPLLPIQILWAELFIDLSASVAFEREPEEPGAMRRPPRPRRQPLLDRGIFTGMVLAGGFTATASLVVMLTATGGADHARWVAFTALAISQVFRAYANRSLSVPVQRLPVNGFLAIAVAVVIVTQAVIPHVPPLADAFRATPLSPAEWAIVAAISLAPAVLAQIMRGLGRRWIA
jgi:Ca2+-transporting ATPase